MSRVFWCFLTVALALAACGPDGNNETAEPTCRDGIQNGGEEGVDCGGVCQACESPNNTTNNTSGATCSDGEQNGDEEGVDCGGSCTACGPAPTCTDGEQNGDEEGVDCGGDCDPCATCTDGLLNQDEEEVDCGGSCPACPTCTDGAQNGDETGVDCGGTCAACPTCQDGAQNGDETGVDCGGSCPACTNCFPDANRIFQTSDVYDADLVSQTGEADGHAAGDALCQLHADAASLGGTWKAWISTDAVPADDHIDDAGPWYRVDRCTPVANNKSALYVNGPENDLGWDENGELVVRNTWTGTQKTGQTSPFNCSDWTSASPFSEGLVGLGDDNFIDGGWTDSSTNPCNLQASLFCFEQ